MSDIFGGPPDDEGFDPFGFPEDYYETQYSAEDPYQFFGGDAPEQWWYEPFGITDLFGETHELSVGEWYGIAMGENPEVLEQMGWEEWDLINWLDYEGYWRDEDWEIWREHYGESQ